MLRFRRKRPVVRIASVKNTEDPTITGGRLYEITPDSYQGPWKLEPGTVLEIVSTPKQS